MGTTTTPPPSPVSAPKNPASREPAATSALNSRMFIAVQFNRSFLPEASLLIAQGLNGIQVGSLPCRIDPEDEADRDRDTSCGEYPGQRHTRGQRGKRQGNQSSQDASDSGESDGLQGELQ